ncbi:uncharacterized protein YndB with AHSA1/START domain [Micromonospora sp. M71_S20]|nr:SRPBCC domain-containing protein [Micromonospora sp. M71_S20]RLK23931.1 uncharacterized protein YndB with AHSA1/START domain [Micromonospora sp. M71_S20]
MGHHFELRKDIELAATPEQVWEAIATGPGIDSWFMGRTEVEPGEGGRTRLTMAGHVEESTITAWEPGKRLADRTATAPDGTFMAMEYLIEGRERGSTTLRLVQSGVLGDDWETEYEAMGVGWDMYLGTLAAYLAHFPGRTATPVSAFRPGVGGADRAWAAVADALGVAGPLAEGQRVRFTVAGLPPIDGVVDLAGLPTYVGVRTPDVGLPVPPLRRRARRRPGPRPPRLRPRTGPGPERASLAGLAGRPSRRLTRRQERPADGPGPDARWTGADPDARQAVPGGSRAGPAGRPGVVRAWGRGAGARRLRDHRPGPYPASDPAGDQELGRDTSSRSIAPAPRTAGAAPADRRAPTRTGCGLGDTVGRRLLHEIGNCGMLALVAGCPRHAMVQTIAGASARS